MARQIPIVGEPFKEYVKLQIDKRQEIYGSGFNQSRDPRVISALNSNTSWIKMASSVKVLESFRSNTFGNGLTGIELAKKSVLFNGLSEIDPTTGNYTYKSGVANGNTIINNSAYGFGGTDFGLVPMPGIINFDVRHENRGSIRTATINLKAYNLKQFELIELLYLRLGFTCIIEWGHSKVLKNNGDVEIFKNSIIDKEWFNISTTSHLKMLNKIEALRKKTNGNYDALFGKVVNFGWNFTPDGTYDIKIDIASLGDVVESFKLSTLTPTIQKRKVSVNTTDDDEKNNNTITEILKDIRDGGEENFNNSDKKFISIEEIEDADNRSTLNPFNKVDPFKKYYIRLGDLLNELWDKCIPYIINDNDCSALFELDSSTESLMEAIPNLISIDPRICIIKPSFTSDIRSNAQFKLPEDITGVDQYMADFYVNPSGGDYSSGIINNIYLNFDFLSNLSTNNSNNLGEVNFYNFFTSVLNGINRSFSNICNLELTIFEENNKLIIRDQNCTVKKKPDGSVIPPDGPTDSGMIEVYGYNNNSSNFVKNYTIETQITNDLKNMLTIGATANNSVVNEDATIFSKWNRGLQDRFQQKAVNGRPESCSRKSSDQDTNNIIELPLEQKETVAETIEISKSTPTPTKNTTKKIRESWTNYLLRIFSRNNNGSYPPAYYEFKDEVVSQGKSLLKNHLILEYKFNFETTEKNYPSSNIGFIPIQLSLEVDGLSGIKIYNEIRINQKFLPKNYPEVMEFIIIGVDHKLELNGWVTTLRALSKPKTIPFKGKPIQGPLNKPFSQVGATDFGTLSNTQ